MERIKNPDIPAVIGCRRCTRYNSGLRPRIGRRGSRDVDPDDARRRTGDASSGQHALRIPGRHRDPGSRQACAEGGRGPGQGSCDDGQPDRLRCPPRSSLSDEALHGALATEADDPRHGLRWRGRNGWRGRPVVPSRRPRVRPVANARTRRPRRIRLRARSRVHRRDAGGRDLRARRCRRGRLLCLRFADATRPKARTTHSDLWRVGRHRHGGGAARD